MHSVTYPVFDYQGRKFIRFGECQRCGECCRGTREPCPYFSLSGEIASCEAHQKPIEDFPAALCNLQGKDIFPESPKALWWDSERFRKCGFWFVELERILVGCPTYVGKDYCREKYLAAYEALDWPAKDLYMVDTTYYEGTPNQKIAWGLEQLRQHFLMGSWDRLFLVEADVIIPPNALMELFKYDPEKKIDWLSHVYPHRNRSAPAHNWMSGFGCSLFSRKLLEKYDFHDAPAHTTTDGWFWANKIMPDMSMTSLEIWRILDIQHLGE